MDTPSAAVFFRQRRAVETQLAHLGDEVLGESLVLGVLLDDGQHFSVHELPRGLADHPFLFGEQALEAHVVGDVGEGGVGAGHGELLECPEASGDGRKRRCSSAPGASLPPPQKLTDDLSHGDAQIHVVEGNLLDEVENQEPWAGSSNSLPPVA